MATANTHNPLAPNTQKVSNYRALQQQVDANTTGLTAGGNQVSLVFNDVDLQNGNPLALINGVITEIQTAAQSDNQVVAGTLQVNGTTTLDHGGTGTITTDGNGNITAVSDAVSGLAGAVHASRYAGATLSGSPLTGTFLTGDWVVDRSGAMWLCIAGGTPGTWQNMELAPSEQYNDLLAWTFDPTNAALAGTALAGAATVCLTKIPLPYTISVTNVIAYLQALAGGALTHSFAALFTSAGAVVGQSADQSTPWGSGGGGVGLNTLALAGGPFTCTPAQANDFLWGALYCGTSASTLPAFHRAAGATTALVNAGTTAATSRCGSIGQANTATLAAITPGSVTPGAAPYWMALS